MYLRPMLTCCATEKHRKWGDLLSVLTTSLSFTCDHVLPGRLPGGGDWIHLQCKWQKYKINRSIINQIGANQRIHRRRKDTNFHCKYQGHPSQSRRWTGRRRPSRCGRFTNFLWFGGQWVHHFHHIVDSQQSVAVQGAEHILHQFIRHFVSTEFTSNILIVDGFGGTLQTV